jgi:hypothetical protein
MAFELVWLAEAREVYQQMMTAARAAFEKRQGKGKSAKPEGLFQQLQKCLQLLSANPRHPGLRTHEYHSFTHPYDEDQKVFEAYVQNQTPGAYRVFWCYGPKAKQITIIAITPHP